MRTRRVRWKAFFIILKGLSISKKFLRLESAPWMLWNSTSWSRLKLTVWIQLALHPWDPFLINNCNMTGSVIQWNVIQNVLLALKPNIYCFCLIICVIFECPSNRRIIYGPELNLWNNVFYYQLLIHIKRKFFGPIFFKTSYSEGEFPRGYWINTATC